MRLEDIKHSIRGDGNPLVLLNMHFSKSDSFGPLGEDLARFYTVITFDFPNQGDAESRPEYRSLEDYGGFMLEFLSLIGRKPSDCIAFGFSFGAHVLRTLALRRDVGFKSLILGGINPHLLQPYYRETLSQWSSILEKSGLRGFGEYMGLRVFSPSFISLKPSVLDLVGRSFERTYGDKLAGFRALLNAPRNTDTEGFDHARRYPFPVHILGCDHDMIIPGSYVRKYAEYVRAESFHLLEDCGHEPVLESPDQLARILDAICRRILDS